MTSPSPQSPAANPAKQYAPAAERNRDPILEVLRTALPARGTVLEIAAGTGQHACHFAGHLPGLTWQPTDPDPAACASIAAWAAEARLPNLRPPLELDVTAPVWPVAAAAAIVCINMIHIAPWAACEGLMAGAGRLLPAGGPLVLYGPYRIDGAHTAPSNAAFDAWLKERDPSFGVRDMADVTAEAAQHGLAFERRVAMPANNFCLILRKEA